MTPIILFYLFATIMLLSALMVIFAKNPVHSALFLILTFCNAAGLFLLAGAEFLAILLVAIYAGAVMVLFLFVVMTMQTNLVQLKQGLRHHALLGVATAFVLVIELSIASMTWHNNLSIISTQTGQLPSLSNTQMLGLLIYTHYIFLFQISGLILLVAIVGAIVLTLRKRSENRRQDIDKQHQRNPSETLELRSIELHKGTNALGGFIRPKKSYFETAQNNSFGPKPGDKTDIHEQRTKTDHST
ncbi:hypothetical protein COMNV_00421 [Commensalibacter sp. Nvir]|uniref:NADH-quinone oxidoreductase subunit J n=1 Tax=Commensalibacter sp. Nvir TaxID=3069817 RepID=UPI002D6F759C|nr:hypothetical protein COMNV_00421 [Commensalibacter sp. Nvir]